ncbi:MAG TPA: serine hydrolase domain-containing protein [Acidimicrobiales bacterium]
MEAERLVARAAELGEQVDGLVLSVALVSAGGEEHSATIGAPDGERLPSCSSFKPIVAAAVRSAARDGVLALDEPLPEGPTPAALLSHRSGLAGDLYDVPLDAPSDEEAAAALLDRFLPLVPRVAPGRFWYSNLGYVLAGLALARAEGEPLLAVVRRRVLGSAGVEVEVPSPGVALRAAGSGIRLRALDLARAGAALARGPLQGLATAPDVPVARLAAGAGQHLGGGFFVDDRYGRRLLAHGGGGEGGHGSAWVVDPDAGWSAAALFDHPAGYALDVAAAVTGRDRGADPLRPERAAAAPGWYVNAYAGVAEVREGELRLNGRPVPARCAADGSGIVVNTTRIVIGSLPYDPIPPPGRVVADPRWAGTYTAPWDDLTVTVDGVPTVRSARRGESPAVALTPTTLASDLGVLELRGDELVAGRAYLFART